MGGGRIGKVLTSVFQISENYMKFADCNNDTSVSYIVLSSNITYVVSSNRKNYTTNQYRVFTLHILPSSLVRNMNIYSTLFKARKLINHDISLSSEIPIFRC